MAEKVEEPPEGASSFPPAGKPRRVCNSPACRAVTSAALFGAGFWVFFAVRNDAAGQPWKLARPWNRLRLGLSICLIAWGFSNLIIPQPKER